MSTTLTESSAYVVSKQRLASGSNKEVITALEGIGRGNIETPKYMKVRNEHTGIMIQQNAKMLNIADEKHAMRKEMNLSKLLVMHKQSLHDAHQELKRLQAL